MKKIYLSLFGFFVFCLTFLATNTVQASGVNFSVTPDLPANQTSQSIGYFSLMLKPNEKQELKFDLFNSSDKTIKVNTTFGTAFTSSTGTVGYTPNLVQPDSSLKINIKDYVQLPKPVTIAAHQRVTISATATMPAETFKGVIAGGFNFEEDSSDTATSSAEKSGITITNAYRYVIGLVLQNSMDKVAPTLTLGDVGPNQVNGRNVITAHLTNSAKAYLTEMNTDATVTKADDSSIKYSFSNAAMEMAPNSNFNLAIPVSIQGALNGKTSAPLQAGNYHLHMTVLGGQNSNGPYQAIVNGQVTKYDYKWTFDRDFTVSAQKANSLNASDPTVQQKASTNWLLIIGLALIILLLLIIIFLLLFKRRKKEDEDENKDATN